MVIDLDRNGDTPLYLQLKAGIAGLIGRGLLPPGARLPSTRELSATLGVNRTTVISAYQELEVEGLVSSHVGRGTVVSLHLPSSAAPAQPGAGTVALEPLLSSSWRIAYQRLPPGLEQLLEEEDPGSISFASHSPDVSLFPTEEFAGCLQSAMRKYGADLLAAGSPRGFPPLLSYLPQFLARRGIRCTEGEVMIVNGTQQALSLVARLFIDPGDTVIMENLTYPGALGAFRSVQATCVGIPLDADGMRVEVVQSVLRRRRAKLLYTAPTYQNPTGTVLPPDRRDELTRLARENELVVVEDDYVHELALDGREVLPLKARDAAAGMISLGSFSEILCPGIRLSWIAAPAAVIDRLATIKQFADLSTNRILQGALLEFIQRGLLERHLKKKVAVTRARRDVMAEAMAARFPGEVRWRKPRGGIFQWVDLPRGIDALALLVRTRREGVLFGPDRLFSVEEWERGGMRLGFAGVEEEKIRKGIGILGDALKEMIAGAAV
jgi:2-aminoadipate transaminase